MNSCLIGVKTLQFQLRATVQGPIAQFGWEGLLRRKTQSMPDSFKGRLPTIEEIESGAGRGFGMSAEVWNKTCKAGRWN